MKSEHKSIDFVQCRGYPCVHTSWMNIMSSRSDKVSPLSSTGLMWTEVPATWPFRAILRLPTRPHFLDEHHGFPQYLRFPLVEQRSDVNWGTSQHSVSCFFLANKAFGRLPNHSNYDSNVANSKRNSSQTTWWILCRFLASWCTCHNVHFSLQNFIGRKTCRRNNKDRRTCRSTYRRWLTTTFSRTQNQWNGRVLQDLIIVRAI